MRHHQARPFVAIVVARGKIATDPWSAATEHAAAAAASCRDGRVLAVQEVQPQFCDRKRHEQRDGKPSHRVRRHARFRGGIHGLKEVLVARWVCAESQRKGGEGVRTAERQGG